MSAFVGGMPSRTEHCDKKTPHSQSLSQLAWCNITEVPMSLPTPFVVFFSIEGRGEGVLVLCGH